jgi:hypothetical protein
MDEEIERLVVSVRADTRGFAADVDAMRGSLDGPLAAGLERAGQTLERSLGRAIQTGKFGFDDLRNLALSVLSEIASAALASIPGLGGGAGAGGAGLVSSITSLIGLFGGAPGRATGGPVSPGRAFVVGENGPEIFVPTSSGRVETGAAIGRGQSVNLTINISDNGRGSAPESLQRSSRQVARMVRQALERN